MQEVLPVLDALNSRVKTASSVLVCYESAEASALAALQARSYANLAIRTVQSPGAGPLAALLAGIRAGAAPAVLVLPMDAVDNLAIVDLMASLIAAGCDIATGSRFIRGGSMTGYPWLRSILLRLTAFTLYAFGRLPVHDPANPFRMYSRRVVDQIAIESSEEQAFGLELLVKCHRLNWRIAEAPLVSTWKPGKGRPKVIELSRAYLKWCIYPFVTSYFPRRAKPVALRSPS
jgi:hypothetical protein